MRNTEMEADRLRMEFEERERIRQHELTMKEKENERIRIECEHEERMQELRNKQSASEEAIEIARDKERREEAKAFGEIIQQLQQRLAALEVENLQYQERSSVDLRNTSLLASGVAVVSAAVSGGIGAASSGVGAAAAAAAVGATCMAAPIAGAVAVGTGVGYAYKLTMSKR